MRGARRRTGAGSVTVRRTRAICPRVKSMIGTERTRGEAQDLPVQLGHARGLNYEPAKIGAGRDEQARARDRWTHDQSRSYERQSSAASTGSTTPSPKSSAPTKREGSLTSPKPSAQSSRPSGSRRTGNTSSTRGSTPTRCRRTRRHRRRELDQYTLIGPWSCISIVRILRGLRRGGRSRAPRPPGGTSRRRGEDLRSATKPEQRPTPTDR